MSMTQMDRIPAELRGLERWVCANADSKRPMCCFGDGPASISRPSSWGDFDEAASALEEGIYEYAGFVFDGDGYVGIDIDHALDEDGLPTEEAIAAIMACGSYTELSKSGTGFHIICKGELPFKGRNNRRGWEIYSEGRYFVLTGRTVMFSEIAEAQDGIDWVLAHHFREELGSGDGERRERIWAPEWALDEQTGRVRASFPPVAPGSRHLSLVSYCGQLHSGGAAKETVFSCAMAANESYLSPPLPRGEVRQVVQSVARYRR